MRRFLPAPLSHHSIHDSSVLDLAEAEGLDLLHLTPFAHLQALLHHAKRRAQSCLAGPALGG